MGDRVGDGSMGDGCGKKEGLTLESMGSYWLMPVDAG